MELGKPSMVGTVVWTIVMFTSMSVHAQVKPNTYGEMITSLAEEIEPARLTPTNHTHTDPETEIDHITEAPTDAVPAVTDILTQLLSTTFDPAQLKSLMISVLESALQSVMDSNGTVSQTCADHLNLTIDALNLSQQWALKMVDSYGKPPSGLLLGNIHWIGTYDECVNVTAIDYHGPNQTDPYSAYKGQYCRIGIPFAAAESSPVTADEAIPPGDLILGVCTPNSCSTQEVINIFDAVLKSIPKEITKNVTMKLNAAICQKDGLEYEFRAIFAIIILSLLALMLIVGTGYDVFVIRKLHQTCEPEPEHKTGILVSSEINEANNPSNNVRYRGRSSETTPLLCGGDSRKQTQEETVSTCGRVLQAFSVYSNGMRILSAKRQAGTLGALNGIRFISMSWVILGHTYAFGATSATNVLPYMMEKLQSFSFMAVGNATVSVDTFFVISGFLVAYLCLKEIQHAGGVRNFSWGLFYFHRFWRLTPPYMLVLALYVPLLQYWYSGPMWPQKGLEKNYCEDTWWKNILYINDFFKIQETCMGWSWYLANDMQFYIVSPLLLIPLYYSGKLGGVVSLLFLVMSFTISGVLSSVNNWPISVIGGGGDPKMIGNYFNDYYVRPYCRVGPYVIGMVTGYILYNTDCKVRMSRTRNILGWLVAAACCIGVLYGPYDTISGKHISSRNVIAVYTAVHRSVWAVGVSWVIFACATGHGGIVNGFLSWKLFIPLSRLTYVAYLIHPVIIFVFYTGKRQLFYITDMEVAVYFVAFLVFSNAAAFVLSLAFESPFMGLEKIFLKRERKH